MSVATHCRPALLLLSLATLGCASDGGQKKAATAAPAVDARAKTASFDGAWPHLDRAGLVTCAADDPATPERVADAMKRAGLRGAFGEGRYRRDLAITLPFRSATVELDGRQAPIGSGAVALPASPAGEVTGTLVFAGYGIVAPERQRNDYRGVDAKGAIVVLFHGRPDDVTRYGAYRDPANARHAHSLHKVSTAAAQGAVGVIFVAAPGGYEAEAGVLPDPLPTSQWHAPIPVVQMQTKLVQKALSPAGVSLAQLQKLLARDGNAAVATKVTARLVVEASQRELPGWAVIGVADGTGGAADHVLVQGACDDGPRWERFRGAPRATAATAVFLGEMVGRSPLERSVVVMVSDAGGDAGLRAYHAAQVAPANSATAVLDVSGVRGREGPLFASSSAGPEGARGKWTRTLAMLPPGGAQPATFNSSAVVEARTAAGAPDSDDIGPALTQLLIDIAEAGQLAGSEEDAHANSGPLGLRLLPAPPPFSGALVDGVERDSPADVGGLQPGDLITAVGGTNTPTLAATLSALAAMKADGGLRISRRGDTFELPIPAPAAPDR